jgi:hypothetical protein
MAPTGKKIGDVELLLSVNHLYKQVWLDQKKIMHFLTERAKKMDDPEIISVLKPNYKY